MLTTVPILPTLLPPANALVPLLGSLILRTNSQQTTIKSQQDYRWHFDAKVLELMLGIAKQLHRANTTGLRCKAMKVYCITCGSLTNCRIPAPAYFTWRCTCCDHMGLFYSGKQRPDHPPLPANICRYMVTTLEAYSLETQAEVFDYVVAHKLSNIPMQNLT